MPRPWFAPSEEKDEDLYGALRRGHRRAIAITTCRCDLLREIVVGGGV